MNFETTQNYLKLASTQVSTNYRITSSTPNTQYKIFQSFLPPETKMSKKEFEDKRIKQITRIKHQQSCSKARKKRKRK